MNDFSLQSPWWLLAGLLVPLGIWLRWRRRLPALVVPYASAWWRPVLVPASRVPALLMVLGLLLLTLGLARPQKMEMRNETRQEGYDIMLAIDLSGSMLAEDFEQDGVRLNRLQAIKPVIKAFINNRPSDRVGLVVFAGKAYTIAPLTFDHEWLAKLTEKLKVGIMEDGTAIGDGLGVALTRLERNQADQTGKRESAFIVLLTDGSNNKGTLKPAQATEIAETRGIPVYTIAAGRAGTAPYPIFDESGKISGYRRILTDIDEDALKEIAEHTGGKYFRADNTETIAEAFKSIDGAEKHGFQVRVMRARDLFPWFLCAGFIALTASGLVAYTPWKKEASA
ncbi:VWA domain-containing protein [Oleiharenicola lentus]|uniref:VWA domain-containing protein n=1 Tax=Oleiharenicola lentus TaxID=2508720 RepID=UPI003F6754F0